jgi:HK97 family phage major capsid protein
MKSMSQLREESRVLYTQMMSVLDKAMAEKRKLTDAEFAANSAKEAQVKDIQRQIDAQMDSVAAAFDAGQVQVPRDPDGKAEWDASCGRYTPETYVDLQMPLRPNQSFASTIKGQPLTFGIGDYCRAMVMGPRTPAERFALQNGTDNAGGFKLPLSLAADVIDHTRTNSRFVTAGALTVPLSDFRNRIMRLADNADPGFRAESSAVDDSQSFTGATYTPKSIAVIVKVPRELMEDALNVNEAIGNAFATSFGAEVDRVCGWGAGGTEPTGIYNTSNILSVAGDSITDYSLFLDALYTLQTYSALPNAVVMSPRESKAVNQLVDSTGQPLRRPDALANMQFVTTANAPFVGDDGSIVAISRNYGLAYAMNCVSKS